MMNSPGEEKQKTNDSEIEKRTESDNNNATIKPTNEQGRQWKIHFQWSGYKPEFLELTTTSWL